MTVDVGRSNFLLVPSCETVCLSATNNRGKRVYPVLFYQEKFHRIWLKSSAFARNLEN